MNEHRQLTHSKYSRETTGRKPALMPDLCFLPIPRNAGEVSSLPSCLFLNKSSDVLKLCEMGKVGGWGETTPRVGWATEFQSKSTNSVGVTETKLAPLPWWTGAARPPRGRASPSAVLRPVSVVSWTVHPRSGTKLSGMCPGQTFEDSELEKLVTGPGSS